MLAVVQFKPRRGARNANLTTLTALTAAALKGGAKVVVLPEMAATGYRFPNPEAIRPMAEAPRGPTWRTFFPMAKEYKAWLIIGFVEDYEGRLYNAAMVISPDGKIDQIYRKRLLYIDDHTWANPGDLPYPSFTTPYGTATLGICMDINDPRFITHVRRTRPDLVCFPTNWVDEGTDVHRYWAEQLRGWNGTLLAADRWGEEDRVPFAGRSAIIKKGQVMVAGPAEGDGWYGWDPKAVVEPPQVEAPKVEVVAEAAASGAEAGEPAPEASAAPAKEEGAE